MTHSTYAGCTAKAKRFMRATLGCYTGMPRFSRHWGFSVQPVASLSCSEEVACRISTYFRTLLRSSERRASLSLSKGQPRLRINHEHLEEVAWKYARVVELWKTRDMNDSAWQSPPFETAFKESLMSICRALDEWTNSWRERYRPEDSRDRTHDIATLEERVHSLEQTWMTWSLSVEIFHQALSYQL